MSLQLVSDGGDKVALTASHGGRAAHVGAEHPSAAHYPPVVSAAPFLS